MTPLTSSPSVEVSSTILGAHSVSVVAKDVQFWQSFSDVPGNPYRFANPHLTLGADSGAVVVGVAGVAAEAVLVAFDAVCTQAYALAGAEVAARAADDAAVAVAVEDAVDGAGGAVDAVDVDEEEGPEHFDAADDTAVDGVGEQELAGAAAAAADIAADDEEEGQELAGAAGGIAAGVADDEGEEQEPADAVDDIVVALVAAAAVDTAGDEEEGQEQAGADAVVGTVAAGIACAACWRPLFVREIAPCRCSSHWKQLIASEAVEEQVVLLLVAVGATGFASLKSSRRYQVFVRTI